MTRLYNSQGIRHIPSTDKYPGLMALRIDEHREIAVFGEGEEVERMLRDRARGMSE